jgi:hypothetical protein
VSDLYSPFPPAIGLAVSCPVKDEEEGVNAAAAFTLLADAMHLKFYEADLRIRVGSLCEQDCFFVAGGEGEEGETFPILMAKENSTLALERAVCEKEKFMKHAIRLVN